MALEEMPKFESGFTWKSILGILYAAIVFMPAIIGLQLTTIGVPLGTAVEFCTLLLFLEYARSAKSPLKRQEAAIIYAISNLAASASFIDLIYREYYLQSPYPKLLGLDVSLIPTWWAPSIETGVWNIRTFVNPGWVTPIAISVTTRFTSMAAAIFFGALGREVYIESERLPFPIQQINVDAVITLTEQHEDRMNVLFCSAVLAFIYGLILYTIPMITNAFGYPIRFIPIPWYDFTETIEPFFPGASFGAATDILLIAAGFVLPWEVAVGVFIGSFARSFLLNYLFVSLNITPWAKAWTPGMDVTQCLQYSTLYYWACPFIGMSFAVGLVPIFLRPQFITKAFKTLLRRKASAERRISGSPFSKSFFIIVFLVGCIGGIIIDYMLAPDFPLWGFILYEIGFPFIGMLTLIRMVGVTGQAPEDGGSFPYLNQVFIMATGYTKVDAWFLPLSLHPGTFLTTRFKICELTGTEPMSYIKAVLVTLPLAIGIGFIYTAAFWRIAPIPSSTFPAPAVTWPIQAIYQTLWITRPTQFFDPWLIIYYFIGTGALTFALDLLKTPISLISTVVGVGQPIPTSFTILIGAMIGRILVHIQGERWFRNYRATIGAGLYLGEGVAMVVGVSSALIVNSIWSRPF